MFSTIVFSTVVSAFMRPVSQGVDTTQVRFEMVLEMPVLKLAARRLHRGNCNYFGS